MTPTRRLPPRDLSPTGFTPCLEALVEGVPEALCATFIDAEGEAIDLCTRIDSFEARIAGAVLAHCLARTRAAAGALGQGAVAEMRVAGGRRTVVARHVGGGCDLVLMVEGPGVTARAAERCAATAVALRTEAGFGPPAAHAMLRSVEMRVSRMGRRVPRAFTDGGVRRRVTAVLGVLEEADRTTFLVRTDSGEELVIAHDHARREWRRT